MVISQRPSPVAARGTGEDGNFGGRQGKKVRLYAGIPTDLAELQCVLETRRGLRMIEDKHKKIFIQRHRSSAQRQDIAEFPIKVRGLAVVTWS
ncbi:hypothetical protein ACO22_00247 [Paracoccidioides brasiliensis]|uniref:Uncharacterized protein n=1 Tax=Paracoccidioides brasiliensis TaxID=121759 RepID=A0A1D2JQ52_PARBR|nr:hypothetical protein ACO22_00247 [Paracoccidioides brasiliensis]